MTDRYHDAIFNGLLTANPQHSDDIVQIELKADSLNSEVSSVMRYGTAELSEIDELIYRLLQTTSFF